MKTYTETNFEDYIFSQLLSSGYHACAATDTQSASLDRWADLLPEGVEAGALLIPHVYDKTLALIPDELTRFVQATQPKQYLKLEDQYGDRAAEQLCKRVSTELDRRGTLDVLREGIRDRGAHIHLMYPRPASQRNPEHRVLYQRNRFAVIRQLQYSLDNKNEIDLGIFLNGVPLFTAELKNSLTGQFVRNAKKQYRNDRDPREKLLRFQRCLAHFAVGNEEVFYTTRLRKDKTFFLPFNRGLIDGGAGNPVNPTGHKTAYLWENTWAPDSVLDLVTNYLLLQENTTRHYDPKEERIIDKTSKTLIFPRYHQLSVVRQVLAKAAQEGPGHNYLVQHSAGSGKSNSIAWLAHGLTRLYDNEDQRVFQTVVVVTDRRVLDGQLQKTIRQFERTPGSVVPIETNSGALQEALEDGKNIIITTLQKFSVIASKIETLKGSRFAVIIDEAHSSQSGEGAKHLKQTLNASLEDAEAEDATEVADIDAAESNTEREIRHRGRQSHISYFAFTATPKNKTPELFGRKNAEDKYAPFHTYTMRQAIEEGFILDVLAQYTTYKRYFRLATAADELEDQLDREVDRGKASRVLVNYVDLSPHAIEAKTNICLDHFVEHTARAIKGRGRAMFVTRSRLHAVRYFLAFRQNMRDRHLPYEPLVAFSGTVRDPDTGAEHTENSLNGLGPKTSIQDALKLPKYRLLVVANKFQTGFDEPLLHTMYLDKKLGGVAAVQTLSRLNRTAANKTSTVVLDFANEAEEIQEAFQAYYQQLSLEEETDPNRLYDLQTELRGFDVYTEQDVQDFASIYFDPALPDESYQPVLDRAVNQWRALGSDEEREGFRATLQSFVRLYAYVAQLITFVDVPLEQEYAFARNLVRKMPRRENAGLPTGITDHVDLDSFRLQLTYEGDLRLEQNNAYLVGIGDAAGALVNEPDMVQLSEIIEALNSLHGIDLTERDRVRVEEMMNDLVEDEDLGAVMQGDNSEASKKERVNQAVDQSITGTVDEAVDLFKKLNTDQAKRLLRKEIFRLLSQRWGDAA